MERDADTEKQWERKNDAEQGIDVKAAVEFVDKIGAEHEETGVSEVYDFQDAVDDGHADRHGGVNAGE